MQKMLPIENLNKLAENILDKEINVEIFKKIETYINKNFKDNSYISANKIIDELDDDLLPKLTKELINHTFFRYLSEQKLDSSRNVLLNLVKCSLLKNKVTMCFRLPYKAWIFENKVINFKEEIKLILRKSSENCHSDMENFSYLKSTNAVESVEQFQTLLLYFMFFSISEKLYVINLSGVLSSILDRNSIINAVWIKYSSIKTADIFYEDFYFNENTKLINDISPYYCLSTALNESQVITKYETVIKKVEKILELKKDLKKKQEIEKFDRLLRWFFRFEHENDKSDRYIYANIIIDILFDEQNSRQFAGKFIAEALSNNMEEYRFINECIKIMQELRNIIIHQGLESRMFYEKFSSLIKDKKYMKLNEFLKKEGFSEQRNEDGSNYLKLKVSEFFQNYILKSIDRI